MALFKIAGTPFLAAFMGGLGTHALEGALSLIRSAGHQDIAEKMKAGSATPEELRTAQRVAAAAVQEPTKAQELYQAVATNPVAQPIAQHYASLLSTQPDAWREFASGSSTLNELAEGRARAFGWSAEQLRFDETSHCPIGGEELSFLKVKYIDVTGKTLLSAWVSRPSAPVWCPDGQFRPYAITAYCQTGHQWKVYAK